MNKVNNNTGSTSTDNASSASAPKPKKESAFSSQDSGGFGNIGGGKLDTQSTDAVNKAIGEKPDSFRSKETTKAFAKDTDGTFDGSIDSKESAALQPHKAELIAQQTKVADMEAANPKYKSDPKYQEEHAKLDKMGSDYGKEVDTARTSNAPQDRRISVDDANKHGANLSKSINDTIDNKNTIKAAAKVDDPANASKVSTQERESLSKEFDDIHAQVSKIKGMKPEDPNYAAETDKRRAMVDSFSKNADLATVR
jgi:hypothetical protein